MATTSAMPLSLFRDDGAHMSCSSPYRTKITSEPVAAVTFTPTARSVR
jgi:hypothetical protein